MERYLCLLLFCLGSEWPRRFICEFPLNCPLLCVNLKCYTHSPTSSLQIHHSLSHFYNLILSHLTNYHKSPTQHNHKLHHQSYQPPSITLSYSPSFTLFQNYSQSTLSHSHILPLPALSHYPQYHTLTLSLHFSTRNTLALTVPPPPLSHYSYPTPELLNGRVILVLKHLLKKLKGTKHFFSG